MSHLGPARKLSLAQARRIALAAQGFGRPRPARPPTATRIANLVAHLGALQLDSVNALEPAHYLPIFSRLGPYDRAHLDRMAGHGTGRIDRRLVEYWAHEASLIPVELHPLFRWRMADVDREAWGSIGAARRVNFERRYDVIERVLPAEIHDPATRAPEDAQRELVRIAARALGVATEPDLGDYFRLPRQASKARVAELERAGELIPVQVEGWTAPAYLWPGARAPRRLQARALLSPFDPLIWFRQRTERLFGFRYRIEIYTPAAQRLYGYYVLPFLLGEELLVRVDLKSDRRRRALLVRGAFAEDGAEHEHVAGELAAELRVLASWLGLQEIEVADRGDLAGELARRIG
jgi:uncharacterized protein YcaQ